MEKLLTISIAAYNMEKYIREALEPLTDARVIDNLEIFVIDDGGTDHTLEIAKEYAAKYPNSIFPIHKENGGYGSTVNYAVAHATGKYFKLLDGDDWFDREALVSLVETLRRIDADIIMTPFYRFVDGVKTKREEKEIAREQLMRISDVADKITIIAHWAGTIRTEILKKADIDLPGKINYTDAIFMSKSFAQAKTIYFCNACVYCYRLGRDGQSSTTASRAKYYRDEVQAFHIIVELYQRSKENNNLNLKLLKRCGEYSYCRAFQDIMCLDRKAAYIALKEFEKEAREQSEEIYVAALRCGKRGFMLRILRMTNYAAFPLVKLAYDIHNKQLGSA